MAQATRNPMWLLQRFIPMTKICNRRPEAVFETHHSLAIMRPLLFPLLCSLVFLAVGWSIGSKRSAVGFAGGGRDSRTTPDMNPMEERSGNNGLRKISVSGNVTEVIDEFLHTDWVDMASMVEAAGRVAALSDPDVRKAWSIMLGRLPEKTHPEQVLMVYLWSRMAELEPGTELPEQWASTMNPDSLSVERVRQSMAFIAECLRAGETITDEDRRAFFRELVKTDAAAAFDFWLEVSKPLDHIGEIGTFSSLLSDPSGREAALNRIRRWHGEKLYQDELIVGMVQPWITDDLANASNWIASLADEELRNRLMTKLAVAKGAGRPEEAFQWSANLPPNQRVAARAMSVNQLASEDPSTGMKLIATVEDSVERTELVKSFSNMLAMQDIRSWTEWRDQLPAAERQAANSTAFGSWAADQQEEAARWLGSQESGQERDMLAAELVRISAAQNTEVAAHWIRQIESPRERMMAVSMALGNIEPGDLPRMEAILEAAAIHPETTATP